MKNIIKITLLTFISAFYISCDEEQFLTEINPNAITTDIFWESEAQFNSALSTVYGALQFQSISGGNLQYEAILGDIAGTESWYAPFAFRNLTYTDAQTHVTDKWNELYIGIFRANQVIENIANADPINFEGESKNIIEAQARFLRAFFYFQVAHTYGKGVLHTSVPKDDADLNKSLSSIEEITNQVIIPDLTFAKEYLPMKWDNENVGRITWGAATSMLGKVYLYSGQHGDAATLFKEVIDSEIYKLVPNVMDNFTDENEFNEESIFEVAYSADLNPGTSGSSVDDTPYASGSESSSWAKAVGGPILCCGGYNTLLSSYFLHELFVNDEVDITNSVNDGNLHSKRFSSSIIPKDGEGVFYGKPVEEHSLWPFGQSAYIKKFTNWYHWDSEEQMGRSGINFRHIRLADVYLMYAEAVLVANSDVNTAIEYIDKVRYRSGVVTLQKYMDNHSGKFPQLHVSKQVHGNQPLVDPTVQSVMTHIQRVERPLELCFEGHRWKDLVRWGIVQEVFDDLANDENWRNNNKALLEIDQSGVAPLYIRERIRPDFNLSANNYSSTRHNYFPIPTQEIQTNNGIN